MKSKLKINIIFLLAMLLSNSIIAFATQDTNIDVNTTMLNLSISIGDIIVALITFVGLFSGFFFVNKKIQQEILKQKQMNNINNLSELIESTYRCFENSILGLSLTMYKDSPKYMEGLALLDEVGILWKEIETCAVNYGSEDMNKIINNYKKKLNSFEHTKYTNEPQIDSIPTEWQIAYFAILHSVAKKEATGIFTSPRYLLSNKFENLNNKTYNCFLNKIDNIVRESHISSIYKR